MLRPGDKSPMNDLCLTCEKPSCPGICDELRQTMGEVESSARGHMVTWHGITRTVGEWAEVFGLTKTALYKRLKDESEIEAIMTALCRQDRGTQLPPSWMEQVYLRLSTMRLDYELYWKHLTISEGSAGLVARYAAVQSAPTNRASNPVERRAMPEITLSDEALTRRAWIACVLFVIERYRMHKSDSRYDSTPLKAKLLEWRALNGWTMKKICDTLNADKLDYEDPITITRLRKYFQSVVTDVAKEANVRGLFRGTQK